MSWKLKTLCTCVLGSVLYGGSAAAVAPLPAGQVGEPLQRPALPASQADASMTKMPLFQK